MGCDIHAHAERREGDRWVSVKLPPIKHQNWNERPFEARQYGKFGFLADVRNYSAITPVAKPRGVPDDISPETRSDYEYWNLDAHSASWLSMEELTAYNYDQQVEDRRCMRNGNGGSTCEPGEGQKQSLREFLTGTDFFKSLEIAKTAGAERIVFWFDN